MALMMLPQGVRRPPAPPARPVLDPNTLTPFIDPLPIPKVARPNGFRPDVDDPKAKSPFYRLAMRQFEGKVHPELRPTRMWGIESASPGPTLETQSGQGMFVEWANELPKSHFLPIDRHLHGAEPDKPPVRGVIHMHGARVPAMPTDIRRVGMYQASRRPTTIRTGRTRPYSGITITQSVSIA